ncbi:uncharacterized protein LOC115621657 [Scaptodrosophila lebanonensis]|uniref:Uncharacterized protein LOC115621657 n=1 Tax=Drosophila lebanonensis TaxID=7225 RepID=A0A6J2T7W6_DROLE|nr:uncharacterized protein LOC115621657 [Scaptodrosophila lebanonensis]
MKLIAVCCFVVGLSMVHLSAGYCRVRCPNTEDVVWALGNLCNVFRNKCYFNQANRTSDTPLTIVSKEECQPSCPTICPQVFDPVWGTYNGKVKQFGNACMMGAHVCTTGKTYLPLRYS